MATEGEGIEQYVILWQEFEVIASKRLEKDGMVGMAVAGGAAVAFGGLVGLGLALAGRQMMKKWVAGFVRQCCDRDLSLSPAELEI